MDDFKTRINSDSMDLLEMGKATPKAAPPLSLTATPYYPISGSAKDFDKNDLDAGMNGLRTSLDFSGESIYKNDELKRDSTLPKENGNDLRNGNKTAIYSPFPRSNSASAYMEKYGLSSASKDPHIPGAPPSQIKRPPVLNIPRTPNVTFKREVEQTPGESSLEQLIGHHPEKPSVSRAYITPSKRVAENTHSNASLEMPHENQYLVNQLQQEQLKSFTLSGKIELLEKQCAQYKEYLELVSQERDDFKLKHIKCEENLLNKINELDFSNKSLEKKSAAVLELEKSLKAAVQKNRDLSKNLDYIVGASDVQEKQRLRELENVYNTLELQYKRLKAQHTTITELNDKLKSENEELSKMNFTLDKENQKLSEETMKYYKAYEAKDNELKSNLNQLAELDKSTNSLYDDYMVEINKIKKEHMHRWQHWWIRSEKKLTFYKMKIYFLQWKIVKHCVSLEFSEGESVQSYVMPARSLQRQAVREAEPIAIQPTAQLAIQPTAPVSQPTAPTVPQINNNNAAPVQSPSNVNGWLDSTSQDKPPLPMQAETSKEEKTPVKTVAPVHSSPSMLAENKEDVLKYLPVTPRNGQRGEVVHKDATTLVRALNFDADSQPKKRVAEPENPIEELIWLALFQIIIICFLFVAAYYVAVDDFELMNKLQTAWDGVSNRDVEIHGALSGFGDGYFEKIQRVLLLLIDLTAEQTASAFRLTS